LVLEVLDLILPRLFPSIFVVVVGVLHPDLPERNNLVAVFCVEGVVELGVMGLQVFHVPVLWVVHVLGIRIQHT
jgi:hypothetical protein